MNRPAWLPAGSCLIASSRLTGIGSSLDGPNPCSRTIPATTPSSNWIRHRTTSPIATPRRCVARRRPQDRQDGGRRERRREDGDTREKQVEHREVAEPCTPPDRAGDQEPHGPEVQVGLERRLLASQEPGDGIARNAPAPRTVMATDSRQIALNGETTVGEGRRTMRRRPGCGRSPSPNHGCDEAMPVAMKARTQMGETIGRRRVPTAAWTIRTTETIPTPTKASTAIARWAGQDESDGAADEDGERPRRRPTAEHERRCTWQAGPRRRPGHTG